MSKKQNKPSLVDAVRTSMAKMFNSGFAVQPNEVEGQFTVRTQFYREQIEQLIKSLIVPKCSNKTWDTDYILDELIYRGVFVVIDAGTNYGIIPQRVQSWGYNIYLRPTGCIVNNPIIGNLEGTDGIDCTLVYLKDNYEFHNFASLIDIFAQRLANIDASIDVNLNNTRLAFIFNSSDSKQTAELKEIYTQISQGKPAVFYENLGLNQDLKMQVIDGRIKEHYIVDLLQAEKRAVICELLTFLGVNNTNVEKKERLITDEVNSNNDEILAEISRIKHNLTTCAKRVNEMYGTNLLSFDFPFWKEERVRPTNRSEEDKKEVEKK